MRARADADLRQAQSVGRLAQVDHGRRCDVFLALVPEGGPPLARCLEAPGEKAVPRHFPQAAAQGEHAHVGVRAPLGLDRQAHCRVLPIELDHVRFDDAFALDGHQCGREAEWHAHLELGDLAGLITLLLGQHVDAVVVFAAEPDFPLLGHVHRVGGDAGVAILVLRADDEFDAPRLGQRRIAQKQAAAVALAAAHGAQVLGFGLVVVGVEAADHPLAAAGRDARDGLDVERHIGLRLAGQVER